MGERKEGRKEKGRKTRKKKKILSSSIQELSVSKSDSRLG